MLTMTSLQAQNNFGALIDTAQREPVLITRRGRPVSVMISPLGSPAQVLAQTMAALRAAQPGAREAAQAGLAKWFEERSKTLSVAEQEGLTEDDVYRMVDEARSEVAAERRASKPLPY